MHENNVAINKSKLFAVRIINLYKYLATNKKEFVLSKQILKSGTSIGANVRESQNAQSKADFINKINIALKEADETQYWLELLAATDYISQRQYESLYNDNIEICKILTSIIKTAKMNGKTIDNFN